jgi:hypothetical protein
MQEGTADTVHIMFNSWKHHKTFILEQVSECVSKKDGRQFLTKALSVIGNSVTDFYMGSMSPGEIFSEIVAFLKSEDLYSPEKYNHWLKENGGYRVIVLSDTSCWTLRLGDDATQYVHIHPGRYSPKTIRIKALTLKTIIAAIYWGRIKNSKPTKEDINQARLELLQESPLKNINSIEGIGKAFKLIAGYEL